MQSMILKSLGLALWITLLQVLFTFFVFLPIARSSDVFSRFEWEVFSAGNRTLRVNLLLTSFEFLMFFAAILVFFGLLKSLKKSN